MADLDSYAFEPGQQVQCKTRFEDIYKGEVVAFDLNTKILILKSPTSAPSGGSNHDLNFLQLDSVSNVEILKEPPKDAATDLPSIDMKYVKDRMELSLAERMEFIKAVGDGVSQEGLSLFTFLTKLYDRSSLGWDKQTKVDIVVDKSVIIKPPYSGDDCKAINSNQSALDRVSAQVRKFWTSQNKTKP